MKMEKAVYFSAPFPGPGKMRSLARAAEPFDWVYLGAEFCENCFPADKELLEAADYFYRGGKKVCFVTPMLSEKGLERVSGFLDSFRSAVSKRGYLQGRFEITVNDFGALELLGKKRPGIKVNAGRLLQDNVFVVKRKRVVVANGYILRLFDSLGVNRFELSFSGFLFRTNLASAGRYGFDPGKFSISLYYPYLNLSSTRVCFPGAREFPSGESVKGIECRRECETCVFEMDHHLVRQKLLIKGNTVFLKVPEKTGGLEDKLLDRRVNRLVYCPFP